MIGYLVTFRKDGKCCEQRFFPNYHSFIYWLNVYMLDKTANFNGDITVISDPIEYDNCIRSFKK